MTNPKKKKKSQDQNSTLSEQLDLEKYTEKLRDKIIFKNPVYIYLYLYTVYFNTIFGSPIYSILFIYTPVGYLK